MSVGMVWNISVVVFNDVVTSVISGVNCWQEQRVKDSRAKTLNK